MYLIEIHDSSRQSWPVRLVGTEDEVDEFALGFDFKRGAYSLRVWAIKEFGNIETDSDEWRVWQPEPYRGPLKQAWIRASTGNPGWAHRVPIDCWHLSPDLELTEANLVRVLDGDYAGDPNAMICRCGTKVLIEGQPGAVDQLVETYGRADEPA